MPAFSFTAPHVTPEQEREEQESLTDEMRQQIHEDMYGSNQTALDESAFDASDEALEGLFQAIERLPPRQKKEYMDAMDLVPKLVQEESPPELFLRCEKSDCEVSLHSTKSSGFRFVSFSQWLGIVLWNFSGSSPSSCSILEDSTKIVR